jgi:hypothetical protein
MIFREAKMGLSMKQWEAEIAKLSAEELEAVSEAMNTLYHWDAFKEHFQWTRMFTLGSAVRYKIREDKL